MMFTDQAKAEFSAMLLKEYGIELSRNSEILPIIYLMHQYEEKMGRTIAAGFTFMDEANNKLMAAAAELKTYAETVGNGQDELLLRLKSIEETLLGLSADKSKRSRFW
jgi:hypothetical protein